MQSRFSSPCLPARRGCSPGWPFRISWISWSRATACLIGCGLGQSEDTQALVWSVIRSAKCPLLIDADGINLVAENIDILLEARCPVVLTPHMGEFAHLTGLTVQEIRENRLEVAADFSRRYGVIFWF